jgi:hypothetical protein
VAKIIPLDPAQEVARLLRENKLPTLEELLQAIRETREIYQQKILAARKKGK